MCEIILFPLLSIYIENNFRLMKCVLLCLLPLASSDLPVHCLSEEIAGTWTLHLGKPSKTRNSCGHAHPDNEKKQPPTDAWLADAPYRTEQITLDNKHGAVMKGGNHGAGTWTLIYDEGWEVRFDKLSFFAFSRFDWVGTQNITSCGATMVGWYNDNREEWGCYAAIKDYPKIPPRKPDAKNEKKLLFVQEAEEERRVQNNVPLSLEWHQAKARKINEEGRTWNAKVYDKWVGKTYNDLNKSAGIVRPSFSPTSRSKADVLLEKEACDDEFKVQHPKKGQILANLLPPHQKPPRPCTLKALAQTQTTDAKEDKLIEDKFPKTFDWRSLGYLEPVMDQADCGSCYVVSTVRMLTARHKVATQNKDAEPFSISFPLYCSEYNQGCQGGYAFLVSRWAHDVGLVPSKCAPYTTSGKCHLACDLSEQKRYRAADYHYIGGWYGNSSVFEIMNELHENGPLVVSFEPSDEFMFYAGGVYTSGPTKLNMGWQKVDHAVLLVGWGEEFGQKYWLVQNSWGTEWGEKGYFRIARGENDSGIESIVVAAKVVEEDRTDLLPAFVQNTAAGTITEERAG